MIVWALVTIAVILAGGFLIISYIYRIQDETTVLMEQNVRSARTAKELTLSLYDIRAASLTYLFDRSPERIAILQEKQSEFITLLQKAKEIGQHGRGKHPHPADIRAVFQLPANPDQRPGAA